MPSRSLRSLVRLGEYELVRRIAIGGTAEIYEARRPGPRGFAKRVAIKRILPELALDPRFVRMFCAEARVHAALQHPNLVSVLDFGESAGELFMVMEYVDGVPLSDVMRAAAARKRRVELGPALHVAREVAVGLAYAHQYRDEDDAPLGVVHRDVCPNNVLLGRAGEVKLTDFGVVHSARADARGVATDARGRAGYSSPEQAQGLPVDARTDLFSLGVVLAEMLLGAPLVSGESVPPTRRGNGSFVRRLEPLKAKVPSGVLRLLRALLAESPLERPADAASVASELDVLATANDVRTSPHGLSLWLADLGVTRVDSNIRFTHGRDDTLHDLTPPASAPLRVEPPKAEEGPATRALPATARSQLATIADEDASRPLSGSVAQPAGRSAASPSDAPSSLRYRLKRPGGEVLGPLSLATVLSMLATARAGLDSELARDDAPFFKLSRAFELTRLAARPLYRFFDPVAVLASERHAVDRGSLASHVLRLVSERRTGLLVHRNGAEQRRVFFEDGAPVAISSTDASELLGARLVLAGDVTEHDLERVLESGYRSGCSLGESLVRAQLISQGRLEQALVEQRVGRLIALCRAQAGELFFIEGARSGEPSGEGAVGSPMPLLLEALRAAYSESELLGLLGGLERTALGPSANCAELRPALALAGDEAYAFNLTLRGVSLGLILREARARGRGALRAAAFAIFVGLSAGAFVVRGD